MKKPLNDYKKELISKYGYDENFAETITIIADSMISHYGEEYESLILDAILSCKYVIANEHENTYELLKRENMLDDAIGDRLLDPESLKLTAGIYQEIPRVIMIDGSYKVDRVDRMIALSNSFSIDHPYFIGLLARETAHLVKSYLNAYQIDNNMLIQRSGLSETTYHLSYEGGEVRKLVISEKGYGFDEGVNTHDEFAIMHESYDDAYEVSGYNRLRVTSEYLIHDLGLKEIIDKAGLLGDKSELVNVLNESMTNGYDGFIRALDECMKLEFERYKNLLDRDKLNETIKKSNEQYENDVVPLIKELSISLNNEKRKNPIV